MRQVGDTMVWLGMILLVAAVIYFTPRLASYVAAASTPSLHGAGCTTCQDVPSNSEDSGW
jgi:hypothetical protein